VLEQSARPKSDLYHDLLPLINAKRIELLDNRRLAAQLIGLERRISRQGKDSIDHPPPVGMTIWRMRPQVCVLGTFDAAYAYLA
jgi:hypothetical protein